MQKIDGKPKSLRQLLTGEKYTVHYYQREYLWGTKQIKELLEDLTGEFLEFYEEGSERCTVREYGHYFMGSIVLTIKDNEKAIIDGQQRLTSLTLLLIYLHHLQAQQEQKVDIKNLIFSEQFGRKSFNIDVEDRTDCLNALFVGNEFDAEGKSESLRNLYARYKDIEELFPEELKGDSLPFFIDWLIEKVDLIEITTETEQDAHKIFETMNDRGLSLTPTEMLKGHLLSEIVDDEYRKKANDLWKDKILQLKDLGKEEDSNFIKNWLRAQYAETIRETKKGAVKEDFDIIGTTFHKWVRENSYLIGLHRSEDYESFVLEKFSKFADIYIKLMKYSSEFHEEFEYIYYNANNKFTLQYQVIMAAISPDDSHEVVEQKIKIVSCYLDQFVALRVFNFKVVDYSSIKNAMFNLTKKIRRLSVIDLIHVLRSEIEEMPYKINGIDYFYLNGFTKRYMRHFLARITHYIEKKSGYNTRFEDYVNRDNRNSYDIEHIWANHYVQHADEFETEDQFDYYRNKFGDLALLPKDKNRSYNDNTYGEKIDMYFGENLLVRSLNEKCYRNNPTFLRFMNEMELEFKPYSEFRKADILERQELYKEICSRVWNVENLKLFLG